MDRAARTFLTTGGEIRAVLKTIFDSPEFWSPKHYQSKIKKPLDLVASSLRAVDGELQDGRVLLGRLRELGEPLYLCRPPTGYPDVATAWINTNTLLARLNYAIVLAAGRLRGIRIDLGSAQALFDQMDLPEPDDRQRSDTRALIEESGTTAPTPPGHRRDLIVASAFKLGSPHFQKR